MDSTLLEYYEAELEYLRGQSGEFAKQHDKVAKRLGLTALECSDPYVERLLEGVAFLTARVRLKMDAEFPVFTQSLIEAVYPSYVAPTPSMCIVRFAPAMADSALAGGVTIPRDVALLSQIGLNEQTRCEYRTAHAVTLWPVVLADVRYSVRGPESELVLRLEAPGPPLAELALDSLDLFFPSTGTLGSRLLEQVCSRPTRVRLRSPGGDELCAVRARHIGFDDELAMLPCTTRSFSGYRLLHEYFGLPERFRFVRLDGLADGLTRCKGSTVELVMALQGGDATLERTVDAASILLWCTPAVNLFPKSADRIQLLRSRREHHVTIDSNRPLDFEVHSIERVAGYDDSGGVVQEFTPLFGARPGKSGRGCYTARRTARVLSSRERRQGPRSSYIGGEMFLTLSDPGSPPVHESVRQLAVRTLATNRDLPIAVPTGIGDTDFSFKDASYPVEMVRAVAGPTKPRPSLIDGRLAWRLISHLSLNYLALLDSEPEQGAAALRGLLALYVADSDAGALRQIDGVRSVTTRKATARAPQRGPVAFVRGLEVTLELDESRFDGTSPFLLASVVDRFLQRFVSLNSFIATTMRTTQRGEVVRWQSRPGILELI